MSLSIVKVYQKNPNPRGGCVCSPHGKRAACTPPYACFTASEMHDPRNPVVVVGFQCLQTAMQKASRSPQGKAELARTAPPAPPPAPTPEPVAPPTPQEALAILKSALGEA